MKELKMYVENWQKKKKKTLIIGALDKYIIKSIEREETILHRFVSKTFTKLLNERNSSILVTTRGDAFYLGSYFPFNWSSLKNKWRTESQYQQEIDAVNLKELVLEEQTAFGR